MHPILSGRLSVALVLIPGSLQRGKTEQRKMCGSLTSPGTPLRWRHNKGKAAKLTRWDLGFGIWDLEFGIWDLGLRIWELGVGSWALAPKSRDSPLQRSVMFIALSGLEIRRSVGARCMASLSAAFCGKL